MAVNLRPARSDEHSAERSNQAKAGRAMWTRAMLLLTLFAVVLPLALLLGIHFGTALVEQVVLP